MKIVFNLFNTGLGNNGGSTTLIRSANTLKELGVDVVIADTGKNMHTWTPLKCTHTVVSKISEIPSGDIIIATGVNSISSTLDCKIERKFFWCRGWEKWKLPEEKLVEIVKNPKLKVLVNGYGLKKKVEKYDVKCELARPGYDFDEIYPLDIRKDNKKITIGGLLAFSKKRSFKRSEWILNAYNRLSKKYDLDFKIFGCEGRPIGYNDNFIFDPNIEQKNKLYNQCDIWLSPTKLEGLHIVAAEAMLTECPVVGTNCELNGMDDYLIPGMTGIISEDDFDDFVDKIEMLITQSKDTRNTMGKNGRDLLLNIGDRKQNMKRVLEIIENWR